MKRVIYTSAPDLFRASLILLLVFVGVQASAQDASAAKSLTGTVKFSEDMDVAAGVNIYLKGSTARGTYSDANGMFQFPGELHAGDVLVFSFIGRETTEFVVSNPNMGSIVIIMPPDAIQMVEDVLVEGDDRPAPLARLFRRTKRD